MPSLILGWSIIRCPYRATGLFHYNGVVVAMSCPRPAMMPDAFGNYPPYGVTTAPLTLSVVSQFLQL